MKRSHKVKAQHFLIGTICIAAFLMLGIGYAILTQQLEINGTAQITSNWKILFTSAEEKEMMNATTTRKEISNQTTLNLNVVLQQPGASATYDVVVENQGTLDAVLSNIEGIEESNQKDPKSIKVSIDNIEVGDPLLVNDKKTFQVKVYWDENVDFSETNMNKEIQITLTYEQSDNGVPVGPLPSDGVDMGGQNVKLVTSGDGLYEDSTRVGRYVYKGANPNNYIQFNNELWRIVAKEADGTYKIVRNEVLSEKISFDNKGYRDADSNGAGGTYCANSSHGCNAWAANSNLVGKPEEFTNTIQTGTVLLDSTLNQYLNGEYLSSITTNSEYIVKHDWGVGTTYTDASKSDDGDVDPSELVAEENVYQWNGKVALLSSSDVQLSVSNEELCGTSNKYENNYKTCAANNYLANLEKWLLLLSPAVGTNNIRWVRIDGKINSTTLTNGSSAKIRPALYLSSNIKLSGNGTQSSPYILG